MSGVHRLLRKQTVFLTLAFLFFPIQLSLPLLFVDQALLFQFSILFQLAFAFFLVQAPLTLVVLALQLAFVIELTLIIVIVGHDAYPRSA
jgi:hypothetical protein